MAPEHQGKDAHTNSYQHDGVVCPGYLALVPGLYHGLDKLS